MTLGIDVSKVFSEMVMVKQTNKQTTQNITKYKKTKHTNITNNEYKQTENTTVQEHFFCDMSVFLMWFSFVLVCVFFCFLFVRLLQVVI